MASVQEQVYEIIQRKLSVNPEQITPEASFTEDLGADSLDTVELVMDLEEHDHAELANLLLNSYLERSGDYEGIMLLRFYLCYRAMVRAKVVTIRLNQSGLTSQEENDIHHAFSAYLKLAEGYSEPGHPHIFITHGLSGSGKTTLTRALMQRIGAIRIRSDIERKRLFRDREGGQGNTPDIYTKDASSRTYQHLAKLIE